MACCQKIARLVDQLPSLGRVQLPNVFDSRFLALPYGRVRYVFLEKKRASHTILLMPDPPNTIEHMFDVINLLKENYQVLVFEALGFGFSRAYRQFDFSVNGNMRVIMDVLNALNIKRVILAMTCIGALPALKVANVMPDVVRAIVLGQTPAPDDAKLWAKRVDVNGLLATPLVGQLALKLGKEKVAKLWYENAFPKTYDIARIVELTQASFVSGAQFSLASQFQAALADTSLISEFKVEQNALILWGEQDKTHQKTNKEAILDIIPNGSLRRLACGHFPDIEMPEAFAQAVHDVSAQV